jgi:RNA polymerase sigma-70 factor, ECF subfamily
MYRVMALSSLVTSPVSQLALSNAMGMPLVIRENVHSSNPRADAAMDRYAKGDDTAFAELYDALAPRMYTFILRKVGNVARAEDLVQQTLLKLHCARARYVTGSCVSPWAFAILRRLHLDQERRKKLEVLSPDGNEDDDVTSPRVNPEESAARREQLRILVDSVLSQLSPPQQAAFELVHYGQMSHAEAAEALGTTVASIKLRVQRANRTLRAALTSANAIGADNNQDA